MDRNLILDEFVCSRTVVCFLILVVIALFLACVVFIALTGVVHRLLLAIWVTPDLGSTQVPEAN